MQNRMLFKNVVLRQAVKCVVQLAYFFTPFIYNRMKFSSATGYVTVSCDRGWPYAVSIAAIFGVFDTRASCRILELSFVGTRYKSAMVAEQICRQTQLSATG